MKIISMVGKRLVSNIICKFTKIGGWCHDHMVVGFSTTCAISAQDHECCEFEFHSWRGILDTTLCDEACQ